MSLTSWGLWGVLVASLGVSGCSCDCKSGSVLDLPKVDPSTTGEVRVSWRHAAEVEARVVCSWTPGATIDAGWSCTPTAKSSQDYGSSVRFRYDDTKAESEWNVTLEGPSGSLEREVRSYSQDPGEGWPGECICYDYRASLAPADLTGVGAKTKS